MASLAPALPVRPTALSASVVAAIVVTLVAFALRLPSFGDPALNIDEQFYLLVGDRLLHGALPYVDIWDRKPIGLFLLYAAIRLLGGDGIVQYQVVATLFAAVTAWLVSRIARRAAPEPAALVAGLLYLLWIETVEGGGGQSPVFYNAFVAGAALLTLRAIEGGGLRPAFAAMALGGVAIQIKTSAVFEVACFGMVLAWWLWTNPPPGRAVAGRGLDEGVSPHRQRHTPPPFAARSAPLLLQGRIVALALTALAPTIAAASIYAAIGHWRDFWFANIASIALRNAALDGRQMERLAIGLEHLVPLAVCTAASAWLLRRAPGEQRRWAAFMGLWLGAAAIGYVSVGAFYYHYLLPLFVPLAAAAAPIFARRPMGYVLAGLAAWIPFSGLGWPDLGAHAHKRAEVARLVALAPRDLDRTCLYAFDGPPILFHLTHACMASRFVFPDHLASRVEEHAIGVEPRVELRRILATRPGAIMLGEQYDATRNQQTYAILAAALRADYRLAGSADIDRRTIDLYVRR